MSVDDGWVLPDEHPGDRALELRVEKRPVFTSDIDDGWTLPEPEPGPTPAMQLTAFCRCGFVAEHCDTNACPRCGSALLLATRRPRAANTPWRPPRHRRSHLPGIHARQARARPLNRVPAGVTTHRPPLRRPRPNLHLNVFLPILLIVTALAGTATWLVIH